jgi:hypothetical protein
MRAGKTSIPRDPSDLSEALGELALDRRRPRPPDTVVADRDVAEEGCGAQRPAAPRGDGGPGDEPSVPCRDRMQQARVRFEPLGDDGPHLEPPVPRPQASAEPLDPGGAVADQLQAVDLRSGDRRPADFAAAEQSVAERSPGGEIRRGTKVPRPPQPHDPGRARSSYVRPVAGSVAIVHLPSHTSAGGSSLRYLGAGQRLSLDQASVRRAIVRMIAPTSRPAMPMPSLMSDQFAHDPTSPERTQCRAGRAAASHSMPPMTTAPRTVRRIRAAVTFACTSLELLCERHRHPQAVAAAIANS